MRMFYGKKPLYINVLNVVVIFSIVRKLILIMNRASIVEFGHLLTYVNDLVGWVFLLIYLNLSVKLGIMLYCFSFACYLLIQFLFVQEISPGIIVSSVFRIIIIIPSIYVWRKEFAIGKKTRK